MTSVKLYASSLIPAYLVCECTSYYHYCIFRLCAFLFYEQVSIYSGLARSKSRLISGYKNVGYCGCNFYGVLVTLPTLSRITRATY